MIKFVLAEGDRSKIAKALEVMSRREDGKVNLFSEYGYTLGIISTSYQTFRFLKMDDQTIFVLGELLEPETLDEIAEQFALGVQRPLFSKFKGNAIIIVVGENGIRIVIEPWFRKLVYYATGGGLAVASELKGVLALNQGLREDLDWTAVHSYIAFEAIYGDHTLFKQVKVFHSGAIYDFQGKHWNKTGRYDYPKDYNYHLDIDLQAKKIAKTLREIVTKYYHRNYRNLFLSGGLDSRTILASFPQELRKGVRGIHISNPSIPETQFARAVAKVAGIDLYEYEPKPADLLEVAIKQIWFGEGGRFFGTGVVRKIVETINGGAYMDGNPGDLNLGGTWANKLSKYPVSPKNKYYETGLILGEPIGKSSIDHKMIFRLFGKERGEQVLFDMYKLIQEETEVYDFVKNQTLKIELYAMHNRIRRQHPEEPNEVTDVFQPFLDDDICLESFVVPIEQRSDRKFQLKVIEELDAQLAKMQSTSIQVVDNASSFKQKSLSVIKEIIKNVPLLESIGRKVVHRRIARGKEISYVPLNTWMREDEKLRRFVIKHLEDFEKRGIINQGILNKMVQEHLSKEANHMKTFQRLVNLELLLKIFADTPQFPPNLDNILDIEK